MISMTRQQKADFNRCCDFLARMIEKYGDKIVFTEQEMQTVKEKHAKLQEEFADSKIMFNGKDV